MHYHTLYYFFIFLQILSSLNLKRKHVSLKDYADEIMLFSGLRELELGGCSLGEEHEMWSHIGSMPWYVLVIRV